MPLYFERCKILSAHVWGDCRKKILTICLCYLVHAFSSDRRANFFKMPFAIVLWAFHPISEGKGLVFFSAQFYNCMQKKGGVSESEIIHSEIGKDLFAMGKGIA